MTNSKLPSATVSITIPSPIVMAISTVASSLHAVSLRLSAINLRPRLSNLAEKISQKLPDPSWDNFKKPLLFLLLIGVVLGAAVYAQKSSVNSSSKVTVKGAKATTSIAKEFQFPIKDDKGKEVTKVKYYLDNAELRDEIIVQGKKATLISGRTFLVLSLKITNDYEKALEINTRDFIRLSVNGNENEWIAADVHNDPVNVRAQSTKTTRLAFTINDTDKNLRLRVGEISGEKQTLDLTLK